MTEVMDNPRAEIIDAELASVARDAEANYLAAAVRAARGESLPASEIQTKCMAFGRSVPQFQATVKVVRRRLDALRDLDGLKAYHDEAARLDGEQKALRDEIVRLQAAHKAKLNELNQRYQVACQNYKSAASTANWKQQRALAALRETAARPDCEPNELTNVRLD